MEFDIGLDCDAGWLNPNGDLYKCEWAGHLILSEEIIKQKYSEYYPEYTGYKYEYEPDDILIRLGWIKLTTTNGYGWWPEMEIVPQAQYDTIFDWCMASEAVYPTWWKTVEVK